MYGGGNTFEGVKTDSLLLEDPVKLSEFEDRIARGEKIEPADWMPQLYRKQLIRSRARGFWMPAPRPAARQATWRS